MIATAQRPRANQNPSANDNQPAKPKAEPKLLHQKYFKSVGPRTYAAQVKELPNGNHMMLLIEGRRDQATGEVRKNSVCVFSEDFPAFFALVKQAADFTQTHPVPQSVRDRRAKFWAKEASSAKGSSQPAAAPRARVAAK